MWPAGDPPPREGCSLDVLIDGAQALPLIAEAIDGARESVHLAGWHVTPGFGLTRRRQRAAAARPAQLRRRARRRPRAAVGGRAGAALHAEAVGRAGGARRARARHADPLCARCARAPDALPPREARDRRRRGGVRRRDRSDVAGGRSLRRRPAPRAPAGSAGTTSVRGCAVPPSRMSLLTSSLAGKPSRASAWPPRRPRRAPARRRSRSSAPCRRRSTTSSRAATSGSSRRTCVRCARPGRSCTSRTSSSGRRRSSTSSRTSCADPPSDDFRLVRAAARAPQRRR